MQKIPIKKGLRTARLSPAIPHIEKIISGHHSNVGNLREPADWDSQYDVTQSPVSYFFSLNLTGIYAVLLFHMLNIHNGRP